MAVDMFLKLDGITGESKDGQGHKDEIDVLAWSWGMAQSGTTHVGGGGGAGKAAVQDISITKYVDNASSTLMQKLLKGEHIASATLTVRKAGGTPLTYIKIDLSEILVTAVSTGGSGGEDRLTENISLNFSKFTFTYTKQKDDGSKDHDVPVAWDIAGNVAT